MDYQTAPTKPGKYYVSDRPPIRRKEIGDRNVASGYKGAEKHRVAGPFDTEALANEWAELNPDKLRSSPYIWKDGE